MDWEKFVISTITLLNKVWFVIVDWLFPTITRIRKENDLICRDHTRVLAGGLAGDSVRLNLNVVCKRSKAGWAGRFNCYNSGSYREAIFYQKTDELVTSEFHENHLPHVHLAYYSKRYGEYTVVMDYIEGSERLGEVYLGNQENIWGAKKNQSKKFPLLTEEIVVEKAFTTFALLHAKNWNDKSLLKKTYLKNVLFRLGKDRKSYEESLKFAKTSWGETKATKRRSFLSPKLISVIDSMLTNSSFDAFVTHFQRVPFTLCHGDFHAGNFLLNGNQDIVFVDWAEVGVNEPTSDLAQMIISDVNCNLVTSSFIKRMVSSWYQVIRARAKKKMDENSYTLETAIEYCLRGGAERWVSLFVIMCGMTAIPDTAMQYFEKNLLNWLKIMEVDFKIDLSKLFLKSIILLK